MPAGDASSRYRLVRDRKGFLAARVTASGTRGWIFRFKLYDRMRDMGLGTYPSVSLAEARQLASEARTLVRRGIDPIDARKKQSAPAPVNSEMTFDLATEQFLDDREGGWKNAKHRQQWRNTLRTYASPVIGKKDVSAITTLVIREWGCNVVQLPKIIRNIDVQGRH